MNIGRAVFIMMLLTANFTLFSEISLGVKENIDFVNKDAIVSDLLLRVQYSIDNLNLSLDLNTSDSYFSPQTNTMLGRTVITLNSNLGVSYSIFNFDNFKLNIGINGSNVIYLAIDDIGQNNLNELLGVNISLEKKIEHFKYILDIGYSFIYFSGNSNDYFNTNKNKVALGFSILYSLKDSKNEI